MRLLRRLGLLLSAPLAVAGCGTASAPELPVRSTTFFSSPLPVDGIYRSMMGPEVRRVLFLEETPWPELLWITGYEAEIVGGGDDEVRSAEFMCHSNFDMRNLAQHDLLFGRGDEGGRTSRLFTLSQGQTRVEFPAGTGVPVLSSEPFNLTSQILNLNAQPTSFDVRHRTTILYVRDRELETPIKPLFQKGVQGMKLLHGRDGYYGVETAPTEGHGSSCSIGAPAASHRASDGHGRSFTGHWVVEPGREVNRTLVTGMLDLEWDTRVYHIAVHLHPFARSLELRDLTAGEVVFHARAVNREDRIGLSHVDSWSDPEGRPLYADHEYELVSVYDNTSGVPQDAMAAMFLYMEDKAFRPPLFR